MILSLLAGAHDLEKFPSGKTEIPLSSSILNILGLKISNSLYNYLFTYGNQTLEDQDITAHADMEKTIKDLDFPAQLEREKRSRHYLGILLKKTRETLPSQRNKTIKILWSIFDFVTSSTEKQQHLWARPRESPFVVFIENYFQNSFLSQNKELPTLFSNIYPSKDEGQTGTDSDSDTDSMPSLEYPVPSKPPPFIPDMVLQPDYPVNPSFQEIKENFEKHFPSIHQPDPFHYNPQGERLESFGSYTPK